VAVRRKIIRITRTISTNGVILISVMGLQSIRVMRFLRLCAPGMLLPFSGGLLKGPRPWTPEAFYDPQGNSYLVN
jgi:hypothetical protein